MNHKSIAVIIVAGGTGSRAGGDVPKQYQILMGKSVLARAVDCFDVCEQVDNIWVVANSQHQDIPLTTPENNDNIRFVDGGETRQQSVYNGLMAIANADAPSPDLVLIHDAARPFVPADMLRRLIDAAQTNDAVIPALPLGFTIKQVSGDLVEKTIPRDNLVEVQTPQAFVFTKLLKAHQRFNGNANFTDDASIMEAAGFDVRLVEGDAENFKITLAGDMQKAENYLAGQTETRTGIGFDVHQLIDHQPAIPVAEQVIHLGGMAIPHEQRLKGHSDADVILHAVVDALLGAMGKGDIGQHFPPSDVKWKNADSAIFVKHACGLLSNMGGKIINIDITLIGEQPKISPYREAIVQCMAGLLKTNPSRINLKATTTEKLGFTGRGEGLAAQAIATIQITN